MLGRLFGQCAVLLILTVAANAKNNECEHAVDYYTGWTSTADPCPCPCPEIGVGPALNRQRVHYWGCENDLLPCEIPCEPLVWQWSTEWHCDVGVYGPDCRCEVALAVWVQCEVCLDFT
jgi:hypothetical protein